jgi:SsrA-binding protein
VAEKVVATNRRARYDYEILDTYEAGLVLQGSEVKSLRGGKANIGDAYGLVREGEAWLMNMHIAPYDYAREGGHDPTRTRKLLLNKREIKKLGERMAQEGLTLVPTKVYFSNGYAKVQLALGRGRRRIDKRQEIKRREQEREMERGRRR